MLFSFFLKVFCLNMDSLNNLQNIPHLCFVEIGKYLTLTDVANLMETSSLLKERAENEILPFHEFNSVCFCFGSRCTRNPKMGMAIYQFVPPFTDDSLKIIMKYESIYKWLYKRYNRYEIMVEPESGYSLAFFEKFLQQLKIDKTAEKIVNVAD